MSPKKSVGIKSSWWAGLSDRERVLVSVGAPFPVLAIVAMIAISFSNSSAAIDDDTARFRKSLDLVAAAGPDFRAKSAESSDAVKSMTVEQLEKNDLKLTSFVAAHASATSINVSSYDEDDIPLGSRSKDKGPTIVEKQLRVEIRETEADALYRLLDRIEKADDPVFIKRLDIRKKRKNVGIVRAVLTVSTFVQKTKEG